MADNNYMADAIKEIRIKAEDQQQANNYLAQVAVENNQNRYSGGNSPQSGSVYSPYTSPYQTWNASSYKGNQQQYNRQYAAEALRSIAKTTSDKQLAKLINKHVGSGSKKDTFWGQTKSSFDIGKISELSNQAWGKYAESRSDADKAIADAYDLLAEYYQDVNAEALDDKNVKAKWISQDMARYAPQFIEQTKAGGPAMIVGAGIGAGLGAAAGALIPTVGEEAATTSAGAMAGRAIGGAISKLSGGLMGKAGGLVAGTKAGAVAGSYNYSYDTMRGAAMRSLLESGVDFESAQAASRDEAIISSAIESLDTGVDLFLMIPGLGNVTKAAAKNLLGGLTKVAIPEALKVIGSYGANVGGEGLEEFSQEIISIANLRRIKSGNLDSGIPGLISECQAVLDEIVKQTGDGKTNLQQALEAARGGAVIGGFMAPAGAVINNVITSPAQNAIYRTVNNFESDPVAKQINNEILNFQKNPGQAEAAKRQFEQPGVGDKLYTANENMVLFDRDNKPIGVVPEGGRTEQGLLINLYDGPPATVIFSENSGLISNGDVVSTLANGGYFANEEQFLNKGDQAPQQNLDNSGRMGTIPTQPQEHPQPNPQPQPQQQTQPQPKFTSQPKPAPQPQSNPQPTFVTEPKPATEPATAPQPVTPPETLANALGEATAEKTVPESKPAPNKDLSPAEKYYNDNPGKKTYEYSQEDGQIIRFTKGKDGITVRVQKTNAKGIGYISMKSGSQNLGTVKTIEEAYQLVESKAKKVTPTTGNAIADASTKVSTKPQPKENNKAEESYEDMPFVVWETEEEKKIRLEKEAKEKAEKEAKAKAEEEAKKSQQKAKEAPKTEPKKNAAKENADKKAEKAKAAKENRKKWAEERRARNDNFKKAIDAITSLKNAPNAQLHSALNKIAKAVGVERKENESRRSYISRIIVNLYGLDPAIINQYGFSKEDQAEDVTTQKEDTLDYLLNMVYNQNNAAYKGDESTAVSDVDESIMPGGPKGTHSSMRGGVSHGDERLAAEEELRRLEKRLAKTEQKLAETQEVGDKEASWDKEKRENLQKQIEEKKAEIEKYRKRDIYDGILEMAQSYADDRGYLRIKDLYNSLMVAHKAFSTLDGDEQARIEELAIDPRLESALREITGKKDVENITVDQLLDIDAKRANEYSDAFNEGSEKRVFTEKQKKMQKEFADIINVLYERDPDKFGYKEKGAKWVDEDSPNDDGNKLTERNRKVAESLTAEEQVLAEELKNAISYSEENGEVDYDWMALSNILSDPENNKVFSESKIKSLINVLEAIIPGDDEYRVDRSPEGNLAIFKSRDQSVDIPEDRTYLTSQQRKALKNLSKDDTAYAEGLKKRIGYAEDEDGNISYNEAELNHILKNVYPNQADRVIKILNIIIPGSRKFEKVTNPNGKPFIKRSLAPADKASITEQWYAGTKLLDEQIDKLAKEFSSRGKDILTLEPEEEAFKNFVKTHKKQAEEAAKRGETYDYRKEFEKVQGNSITITGYDGRKHTYYSSTAKGYLHFILDNDLIQTANDYINERTETITKSIEEQRSEIESLQKKADELSSPENLLSSGKDWLENYDKLQSIKSEISELEDNIKTSEDFLHELNNYGITVYDAVNGLDPSGFFSDDIAAQFKNMSVKGMANATSREGAAEIIRQAMEAEYEENKSFSRFASREGTGGVFDRNNKRLVDFRNKLTGQGNSEDVAGRGETVEADNGNATAGKSGRIRGIPTGGGRDSSTSGQEVVVDSDNGRRIDNGSPDGQPVQRPGGWSRELKQDVDSSDAKQNVEKLKESNGAFHDSVKTIVDNAVASDTSKGFLSKVKASEDALRKNGYTVTAYSISGAPACRVVYKNSISLDEAVNYDSRFKFAKKIADKFGYTVHITENLTTYGGKDFKFHKILGQIDYDKNGNAVVYACDFNTCMHELWHGMVDEAMQTIFPPVDKNGALIGKDISDSNAEAERRKDAYLKERIRSAFDEAGKLAWLEDLEKHNNYSDKSDFEELYEELFVEIASAKETGADKRYSPWVYKGTDLNYVAKVIQATNAFKDLKNTIQKGTEGVATRSFRASGHRYGLENLSDERFPGGAEVFKDKGYPEPWQNMTEAYSKVEEINRRSALANEEVMNRITRNSASGKALVKSYKTLTGNMEKVMSGDMTMREFYESASTLKNTTHMEQILDETALNFLSAAAEDEDKAFVYADSSHDAKHKIRYLFSTSRAMEYIASKIDRVDRVEYGDKVKLNKAAKENGKGNPTGVIGKAAQFLNRMQISGDNVWKMIDGYNKAAHGIGYQMARKHDKANATKITTEARAKAHFADLPKTKGFNELMSGKTKGKIDSLINEISLKNAINSLIYEEQHFGQNGPYMEESWKTLEKIPSIAYEDADGNVRIFELEQDAKKGGSKMTQWKDILDTVTKDIQENEAATAYDKAITEMLTEISPDAAKASKAVYGYARRMYEDGKYFPVERYDESKEDSTWSIQDDVVGIAGAGHFKSRNNESNAPLLIRPASQVIDGYIAQASNFIAYSDFGADLKVLMDGNGANGSFANTLGNAFGETYGEWFKNYTDTMNMIRTPDLTGLNRLLGNARARMMQGALLGSVSVPIKQISSYWAAMGVVDPRAVVRAFRPKLYNSEHRADNNPFAMARRQGSIEQDMSAHLKTDWLSKIRNSIPGGDLLVNATNIMDSRTVNNVYKACIYDVAMNTLTEDQMFKEGGKGELTELAEFYVNSKFQEAVLHTQPIFVRQARNELARSNSEILRMFSTFRTQQTQNYNRLLTTVGEYRAAMNKEGQSNITKAAATKHLRDTVKGQVASAVSLSLLTTLANALLHKHKKYEDEEGEVDYAKVFKRIGLDTLETAASTSLFGGELSKWLIDQVSTNIKKANGTYSKYDNDKEFYGISMGAISSVQSVINAVGWYKDNPSVSNARYVVNYTATVLGIPLSNAYTLVNAGVMWSKDIVGDNEGNYDDMLKSLDAARKDYGNQLYNAMRSNNDAKAQKALGNMGDQFLNKIKATSFERLKSGKSDDFEVAQALTMYGGMREDKAYEWINQQHMEIDTGYKYSKLREEWAKGNISTAKAIEYEQTYGNKTKEKAQEELQKWQNDADSEEAYGVQYSKMEDAYLNRELKRSDYVKAVMEYEDKTREEAEAYVSRRDFKAQYDRSYTDLNKMVLNGEISDADAVKWYKKTQDKTDEQAETWLERYQFQRATGYEANWRSSSDLYDSYSSNEKMGIMTFYNTYGNQFKSAKQFGKVFNELNNVDRTDWPTYHNPNGYDATTNQARVITQMNNLIKSGELSYDMAHTIWVNVYGWKANNRNAWSHVHK